MPVPAGPGESNATLYTDLETVKAALGKGSSDDRDDLISAAIGAACRMIDQRCGRRFYADDEASARTYAGYDRHYAIADAQALRVDDIADTTGMTVETKTGFTSTTWTTVATWSPGPANADVLDRPRTEVVAAAGWVADATTVRVTAVWGWSVVPDAVIQAATLQAARLYRRKDSPQGVLGSAEWGVARVSRFDPDVEALIAPYIVIML